MHHDHVGLLCRLAEELGDGSKDERVANPMESILPQPICLGDLLVDRVCLHVFGKGLMERGVEKGDAGNAWKFFSTQANYLQGGEIVSNAIVSPSAPASKEMGTKFEHTAVRAPPVLPDGGVFRR